MSDNDQKEKPVKIVRAYQVESAILALTGWHWDCTGARNLIEFVTPEKEEKK